MPVAAEPVKDLVQALPQVIVERRAMPVVEVSSVQDGPIEVELGLLVGGITEPYRARGHVAGEVCEVGLFDVRTPVDTIEGLQVAVSILGVAAVPEPAHEVPRLLVEADGDQGV